MRTELVTTLKRKATELLADLGEGPILITEHGKPAAILIEVDAFESMKERITILEGIARGEKAVLEGRTVSHAQAEKTMKRWLEK